MNKKVLVLSGSYRKRGNSDRLCDQFILGAREAGHTAEKIHLGDKKINHCIGCRACQANEGKCVHSDDMADVMKKMLDADVIVIATPVYFYAMAGQVKTLIDRVFARGSALKNKEFYIIVSATDRGQSVAQIVIQEFRGFFHCLPGAIEKGIIYGTGARNVGDIEGMPAMTDAYKMGKSV